MARQDGSFTNWYAFSTCFQCVYLLIVKMTNNSKDQLLWSCCYRTEITGVFAANRSSDYTAVMAQHFVLGLHCNGSHHFSLVQTPPSVLTVCGADCTAGINDFASSVPL